MTTYAWPGWGARRFELRVLPNLRAFVGPYTPSTQVIDLLGERWQAKVDLVPTTDPLEIAAREAFFDRLKGMAHLIAMPHLKLSAPQGTMRGSPTLQAAAAQLANTVNISTTSGATLKAGDMLGIGGQLCRVMANATADGTGLMAGVEIQPRLRVAKGLGTAVTWSAPTANFMLKTPDGVPTVWSPGFTEGANLDLIEVF
jgi:hypothetical protein